MKEIEVLFEALDKGKEGYLEYEAIQEGLTAGGFTLVPGELSKLGIEPGTRLTFAQFASALVDWQKTQGKPYWQQWCSEAFRSFDLYGSGVISPDQILREQKGQQDAIRFSSFEAQDGDMHDHGELMAVLRNGAKEAGDEYIDLSEFMSVLQTGEGNSLELYDRRHVDWDT